MKKLLTLSFIICHIISLNAQKHPSYKGLVMAGYQGWFNTPTDGDSRGWHHLAKGDGMKPGSCNIDLWPDVSEYSKTYPTGFYFANGENARIFSSSDESTVFTHFRWMKDYGIDGVFMQRFVSEIRNPSGLSHFNKVLASAMKASDQYDRSIAIMYDLSGMKSGEESIVLKDADQLATQYHLFDKVKCGPYLYHNHKPLVCVWGIGFNDHRAYGLKESEYIIDGLKKRGFSIMIGVPTYWRDLRTDTEKDEHLHALIKKCDVVMPWFVGRYNETSYPDFKQRIGEDIRWCQNNQVDYVPLVFPGFSWRNMKGQNTTQIPRNKGSFLWKQISGAIESGSEMLYVAMFDEMDEGTAIFKCVTEAPVGESKFVTIEQGKQSDYYLWLVGEGGNMLNHKIPFSNKIPIR
ncbi:MAG: glycoside hydrolase family 71/99-like protein [Bacteroidota bacterium]|nr:glycoside hydrolase family 71/99-like protein [Bacteroidota bacterium]